MLVADLAGDFTELDRDRCLPRAGEEFAQVVLLALGRRFSENDSAANRCKFGRNIFVDAGGRRRHACSCP